MGRRLGLIVGVNHYQDVAVQPLRFAENDAQALAQWLVSPQGGNWVPTDIQLLCGSQATSEQVKSLIMEICVNDAGPDDLVFIYLAGHAFLDEMQGEGYFALANTYYQRPETGLHLLSMVRQVMEQSRVAQVLVILDCFHARQPWSTQTSTYNDFKPLLGATLLDALQQREGRLFLCSCRGDGLVAEVGEGERGLLADGMIAGLSGQADDHSAKQLTLQQLYTFLCSRLDEQHQPQLFGRGSDTVLLVGEKVATVSKKWLIDTRNVPSIAENRGVAGKVATVATWLVDTKHVPGVIANQSVAEKVVVPSKWLIDTQNVPSIAENQVGAEKVATDLTWLIDTQNVPSIAENRGVAGKVATDLTWLIDTQNVPSIAENRGVAGKVATDSTWLIDTQSIPSIAENQVIAQTVPRRATTDELPLPTSPMPAITSSGRLSLSAEEQQRQQQSIVLLKQAEYLVQMQNSAAALMILGQALQAEPTNVAALVLKGQILGTANRLQEALAILEQALQAEPTHIPALILKGQLLGTANRFREAMSSIDQVIRIDENNALAWSIRAALLANMGQFLDALPAVEHSIELQPDNPKTLAIKAFIMANLTPSRNDLPQNDLYIDQQPAALQPKKRGGAAPFLMSVGIQLLGLTIGTVGAVLPMYYPTLPIIVIFLLESLGLVLLCINAARGSYVYGFTRLLLIFLTSAIAAGVLGELYKFDYYRLVQALIAHQPLLGSILLLSLWLALTVTLPLLLAVGGFIGGIGRRARRRRVLRAKQ